MERAEHLASLPARICGPSLGAHCFGIERDERIEVCARRAARQYGLGIGQRGHVALAHRVYRFGR